MNPAGPAFDFDEPIDRSVVPALKVHPTVLGQGGEQLFPAGVADMDYRIAPPIVDALRRRLDHELLGYEAVPDGLLPALRDWVRRRHGWALDLTHVQRAPNVLNILATATSLFTRPGDGVIIQPPVFVDFFDVIEENGRRIVSNPLRLEGGQYRMNFEDLAQLAADPSTTLLYLCNPHNPVGRVWSAEELRQLGDICAANEVLVVADEIHGDIALPGYRHTPFASLGDDYAMNCIGCLSPAKTFNIASCCSAFSVIADEQRRQRFQAENSRLTVNKNNAFANVAMEAAYTRGDPWLDQVLEYLGENAGLLAKSVDALDGVELVAPQGTFLAWLDFRPTGLPPDELARFLRTRARWACSRGERYGSAGKGFARLNFACTRARLADALERLDEALCSLRSGDH